MSALIWSLTFTNMADIDRGLTQLVAHRISTVTAWLPFGPCSTSNATRWFSRSVANKLPLASERQTNKHSLPLSGSTKPYPLHSSYHFTVPVSICFPIVQSAGSAHRFASPRSLQPHSLRPQNEKHSSGHNLSIGLLVSFALTHIKI